MFERDLIISKTNTVRNRIAPMHHIATTVVVVVVVDVLVAHRDPGDPKNISDLSAVEWFQKAPQSVCLKDAAPLNIEVMSVTRDTFHLDV